MSKFDELFNAYIVKSIELSNVIHCAGGGNKLGEVHDEMWVAKSALIDYVHKLEKTLGTFNDFYTGDTSYRSAPPVGVDKQENRGTLLSDNQTDKDE